MKKEEFLKKFNELLDSQMFPDNSEKLHTIIEKICKKQNWLTIREHKVKNRGDGHPGYIDLMIIFSGLYIGIEIDNLIVKKGSIFKLLNNKFDLRIILLRGICEFTQTVIEGIDMVKILNVRGLRNRSIFS